jgi:CrcB protein
MKLLAIGLGGAFGALARYGLSGLLQRGAAFPVGTLAVNVLGCFLIGVLFERLGPGARQFVVVGVLGGFTTFSAFGYETLELLRGGEPRLALANVAANVVLGVGAVLVGRLAVGA